MEAHGATQWESGARSARADDGARFVRLAADLGDCMAFEPRRWREVFERSSQTLSRSSGVDSRGIGVGSRRGGGVVAGRRQRAKQRAGLARGRSDRARQPGSRNEGDDRSIRLPPVLVEQYLNQPRIVGELLRETGNEVLAEFDAGWGNQGISQTIEPDSDQYGISLTLQTDSANSLRVEEAEGQAAVGDGSGTPPPTAPAMILPVLSTISPSMRRGMSRLPSPTREDLLQVQHLEQLADQKYDVNQFYRALTRQHRDEKRASSTARVADSSRRRTEANADSPSPITVSTSASKRRLPANDSISHQYGAQQARTALTRRHQLQFAQQKLTELSSPEFERVRMAGEDRDTSACAPKHTDAPQSSRVSGDPGLFRAETAIVLRVPPPDEPNLYRALVGQHEESVAHVRKVDEQVKQTIAEVRRWLPLDVIYEFGLGKFASPAHQRATELIARVGIRLQHGLLAHAMDQWKWWLDQTTQAERDKSSVRLQCWWRQICAAKELLKRRRIRLELQRRQLAFLRHLSSKQQQAALRITSFFRRCVHVRSIQRRERESTAATAIQKFWRKSSESWLALRRHIKKRQQNQAAICIQRYTRGMFARRIRRLLAKVSRVTQRQQAAKRAKMMREQQTQFIGAAITIQQGFREWSHRRVVALRRRRAAFEKDKRAIVLVQAFFRGKQTRRSAQRYRVAVASAVVALQCWWRCVCAQKAISERRSELRNYRQRIREEVRNAKPSAFANVLSIKQKWTRLAAATEPTTTTKDGKQYTASEIRAVARIQGFWRGLTTRKRLRYQTARQVELARRTKRRRLHAAATCIQRRIRGIQGRARAWHRLECISAEKIQSFWRGVQTRRRLLQARNATKAVTKMQARWRSRRRKETLRLRIRAATTIQRLIRKCLGKKWLYLMVRRRQFLAEEQEMGKRLMEATKARIKDELLLQSFVFQKPLADDEFLDDKRDKRVDRSLYRVDLTRRSWKRQGYDGVWQQVFRDASGNSAEIDSSHFARFLKLLPHSFIHKSQFPAQKADLCFAKMKEPKAKAISFSRFNKAMLLVLREKFTPPASDPVTKRQDKSSRSSSNSSASPSSPVTRESVNETEVDHANFLRFMNRYVLPSAIQDGKYRKMLGEACTYRLMWAVAVLRRFAAQMEARKKHDHFMVVYRERQAIKLANQRARVIQKCYRKHKFRCELKTMLGAMFIEFVDYRGRAVKFQHKDTGKTVSRRPVFLKGVVCGKTIPLPFPGEEFQAVCERHEDSTIQTKVPAEVYCVECEDAMCQICFTRDHSKRHALQQHHVRHIQLCSHCGSETATRECMQCGNGKVPFCDCCFPLVHQQDTKEASGDQTSDGDDANSNKPDAATAMHRTRQLVVMCVECSARVAQWTCDVCNDVFCKRCLVAFHAKGMRQFHQLRRLSYYSVLREQAEEKRKADAEKRREMKRRKMEEEARQREAELDKQNRSATTIQALVRSLLARRQGRAYMKLVRQTQVAFAQRQKDDRIRATLLYKVRSALGLAPALKSDTTQEIVARQQRLADIKRMLLLEHHLLANRPDASDPRRERRWTMKQRARAEHAARTWCVYDCRVRIRRGEWRGHTATIVSTQNLLFSGRVLVFVELPKRSAVLDWEWLEPFDDDERLRQPYEPPHKVVMDLSRDFQARLTRMVERTARLARLLYLQTIEFNDIVQYAWVVEFNKLKQRPEYWNVVLNKRTDKVPKAMELIERMDEVKREKLDARVALAKQKLELLLHPFQPRNKPRVAQRRNAIVRVAVRVATAGEQALSDNQRVTMKTLRESMQAVESARFWHGSVEANPKLPAIRRAAAKFASACSQPPQSSRICWQLTKTLQWMDLHAEDGFEVAAKMLFALSTELQLFVVGELAQCLDENGEDFKAALPAFQQLLKLKEETLHLLLSKHEAAAAADAERDAAAAR